MNIFNNDNINGLIKSTKRRLSLLIDRQDVDDITNTTNMAFSRNQQQKWPSSSCPAAKRVRFSEFSSLTMFSAHPREVVRAAWYSKRDIDNFKRDIRHDTLALRETMAGAEIEHLAHSIISSSSTSNARARATPCFNVHDDIEELDARGLEHLISPQVLKLIFQRRKLATSRVIQEQEMQKELGIKDNLRLSQVSRKYTGFSKEWSSHIAMARVA